MKLEAKTRLKAWQRNAVSHNSLWKRGIKTIKPLLPTLEEQQPLNGFKVYRQKASSRQATWVLADGNTVAAVATIAELKAIPMVQTMSVNPAYQGTGRGFAFYEYLLKRFHRLSSSISLSGGSAKIWARLLEKYKGGLRLPNGTLVKVHGFVQGSHGFLYPVVLRNGLNVDLGTLVEDLELDARELTAIRNAVYYVYL